MEPCRSRLFARSSLPRFLVALLAEGGSARLYSELVRHGLGMGSVHDAALLLAEMGLVELDRAPQLVARLTPRGRRVAELLRAAALLAEGKEPEEELNHNRVLRGMITRFSGCAGASPHTPETRGDAASDPRAAQVSVRRVRVG